jgi:hypothetical protein
MDRPSGELLKQSDAPPWNGNAHKFCFNCLELEIHWAFVCPIVCSYTVVPGIPSFTKPCDTQHHNIGTFTLPSLPSGSLDDQFLSSSFTTSILRTILLGIQYGGAF